MLYNYSVTPIKEDHFEERVADIIDLVKRKVIYMPLFCMTLTPEGNPVWDKVSAMAELYEKYKKELDKAGVESGILVQASIGHGYPITRNPFQPVVRLRDGVEEFSCCPEDEAFLEHFSSVLKTLAEKGPKAIMLDDDFRLMMRGGGCTCPLHMAEFNRRAGTSMTAEELREHIFSHDENDALTDIFREIQKDSLVKAATRFRAAIDSVDPSIQGINCTSGHICENVMYTNKVFAGKGNPTIVRIPNGIYAPITIRGFSDLMGNAAICHAKLKKAGIDIILSETDTIPFNRYAKSARYLHAHYTASMLEGLKGAKHWLSRSSAFEPKSGKAYRDILAKNYPLYEKLSEIAPEISWCGIAQGYIEQEKFAFNHLPYWRYNTAVWTSKIFERMGIPFYFAEGSANAVFLEGRIGEDMTDSQIKEVFKGNVFLDGFVAKTLTDRGYGHLLGVKVSDWDGGTVSGETFDGTVNMTCTKQKNHKNIEVTNEKTEILTYNYLRSDGGAKLLAPAVTCFEREGGKYTVTFCGSPDAEFNYGEGFAFLNESRKNQFINLFKKVGALPVYCDGDDEVCLRAGYLADKTMLVAMYLLGIDDMESVTLYLEKEPKEIKMLKSDASEETLEFESVGDNLYNIKTEVKTLEPCILLIK